MHEFFLFLLSTITLNCSITLPTMLSISLHLLILLTETHMSNYCSRTGYTNCHNNEELSHLATCEMKVHIKSYKSKSFKPIVVLGCMSASLGTTIKHTI